MTSSPTLCITRGLPASGKSTWARQWVLGYPSGSAVRINRDDLRRMLFRPDYGRPEHEAEKFVTTVQQSAARAALIKGVSVVIDDTNLRLKNAREWASLAMKCNATFFVKDFDTDKNTCIRRDSLRTGVEKVGADVIENMYKRYRSNMFSEVTPEIAPTAHFEPYAPNTSKKRAVMVDIDGTVALMSGRSPYDPTKYHTDLPNVPVITAVKAMADMGHTIVYLSGRDETYRGTTVSWLIEHLGPYALGAELFMRPAGDVRNDAIVKLELFDAYVRDRYNVVAAFDDRDRVVAAWRSIGLTVFQVAEGSF